MYFTVYKTTNNITGEIYIGKHNTNNLDDRYLGSGTRLINSVNKYGVENFSREILYVFDTEKEALDKEAEIVNEDFVNRSDTLNIVVGGTAGATGRIAVYDTIDEKYTTVSVEDYQNDKGRYEHPTANTVPIIENNTIKRIPSSEYSKNIHVTPSTGKVTVRCLETSTIKRINVGDFDKETQEKIFGGIVVEIGGKKQYTSRDEFEKLGLSGVHKGKVTVKIKETGEIKHVDTGEFKHNRHLYEGLTEGKFSVMNKETKERFLVSWDELGRLERSSFVVGTEGQTTVYDLKDMSFKNIRSEDFDSTVHKLPVYSRFEIYDSSGKLVEEFWDNKKKFFSKYPGPERLWTTLSTGQTFVSMRTAKEFNGWYGIVLKKPTKHDPTLD